MHHRFGVGKREQSLHPCVEFAGVGRRMQDGPVALVHDDDVVGFQPESPDDPRVVLRAFGQDPLQFEEHGCGQTPVDMLAHELHPAVVVRDHRLAPIPWRAACSEHLLGDPSGRRGTLELARGDRLLDQRAHQVPVPGTGVGDIDGELDPPAGVAIDLVQHAVQVPGIGIRKGAAPLVGEGEGMAVRRSRQLDREPPVLVRESLRADREIVSLTSVDICFLADLRHRIRSGKGSSQVPLAPAVRKATEAWAGASSVATGRCTGPKCKLSTNSCQISI